MSVKLYYVPSPNADLRVSVSYVHDIAVKKGIADVSEEHVDVLIGSRLFSREPVKPAAVVTPPAAVAESTEN